jgi:hypothetical protein
VEISHSDLGPNKKINEERKDTNSRTHEGKYDFNCADFHKTHACSTNFLKNSGTQFEENQSSGLYADPKGHTDGQNTVIYT